MKITLRAGRQTYIEDLLKTLSTNFYIKIPQCTGKQICAVVFFCSFADLFFFSFPINDGIMTLYIQKWEWRERIEGK